MRELNRLDIQDVAGGANAAAGAACANQIVSAGGFGATLGAAGGGLLGLVAGGPLGAAYGVYMGTMLGAGLGGGWGAGGGYCKIKLMALY